MLNYTWESVPTNLRTLIKDANVLMSDIMGPPAEAIGLKSGPLNEWRGGPRPLTNLLAGATLGAGAGYGAGWLAEHLLPEDWFEKGRLRKTTAILGGLGLSIPGMWQMADNLSQQRSVLDPWPPPVKQGSFIARIRRELRNQYPSMKKAAWDEFTGATGGLVGAAAPIIPRDRFNNIVWDDPLTPTPIRAATMGLVEAGSLVRGDSPFVSPMDIARVAVGAGSGYVSGLLVGKTLGALAGLNTDTQKELQRIGTWSGILKTVVPMVLR